MSDKYVIGCHTMDNNWLSIREACEILKCSDRTIYRKIDNGELVSKKEDGRKFVRLTSDKTDTDVAQTSNTELFEYLKDENKRLIEENRRLQEEISESNIRKDTLVLQFTERLSEQRQLIEEIRRPRWKRWRRSTASAQ